MMCPYRPPGPPPGPPPLLSDSENEYDPAKGVTVLVDGCFFVINQVTGLFEITSVCFLWC